MDTMNDDTASYNTTTTNYLSSTTATYSTTSTANQTMSTIYNHSTTGLRELQTYCIYFTKQQCDALDVTKKVLISLSVIATVLTILLAVLLRKYRTFPQRIVLHVLVNEMIQIVVHTSTREADEIHCVIEAFFAQWTVVSFAMWMSSLAVYIYLRIQKDNSTDKYEWVYTVSCYVPALVCSCLPFITGDYGFVGNWCWITNTSSGKYYRFILGWGPVILSFVTVFGLFLYLYVKSRVLDQIYTGISQDITYIRTQQELMTKYLQPFLRLAIAFLILNLASFSNRVYDLFSDIPSFGMVMLHTVAMFIGGTLFSLMFFTIIDRSEYSIGNIKSKLHDDWSMLRQGRCCLRQNPPVRLDRLEDGVTTPQQGQSPASSRRSTITRSARNAPLPTVTERVTPPSSDNQPELNHQQNGDLV